MKTSFCLFLISLFISCNPNLFKSKWTNQKAPEHFKARFITTKGEFVIDAYREWSPQAVDRLYQLLRHKYFTNIPVYRVMPEFVAQFGGVDTVLDNHWEKKIITDEPVIKSNLRGSMAIARGGKDSRGNHFYINLKDNVRLDTLGVTRGVPGFPVVATVSKGMDIVASLYAYRDTPRMELRKVAPGTNPLGFYKHRFPKMDFIKKAQIVKY